MRTSVRALRFSVLSCPFLSSPVLSCPDPNSRPLRENRNISAHLARDRHDSS